MTVIKVNYAALENAKKQIDSVQGMLNNNLDDLRGRLMGLDWQGVDRDAYQQHQKQWDDAVVNLNDILGQIGREVDNAKVRFHENEMRGARRWGG